MSLKTYEVSHLDYRVFYLIGLNKIIQLIKLKKKTGPGICLCILGKTHILSVLYYNTIKII